MPNSMPNRRTASQIDRPHRMARNRATIYRAFERVEVAAREPAAAMAGTDRVAVVGLRNLPTPRRKGYQGRSPWLVRSRPHPVHHRTTKTNSRRSDQ
jgi:hypothetical protein